MATYVGNYMTTYAIATLHFPSTIALAATVVGGLGTLVFSLFGGWLSDRVGRTGSCWCRASCWRCWPGRCSCC